MIYIDFSLETKDFFTPSTQTPSTVGTKLVQNYAKSIHFLVSKLPLNVSSNPRKKVFFNLHDPNLIRHLYQLRVGLSSLRAHKKRHNFIDTPNDECSCGIGKETTEHFLLKCPLFTDHRQILLSIVNPKINRNDEILTDESMTQILLYGDERLTPGDNNAILRATLDYFYNTERFSQS